MKRLLFLSLILAIPNFAAAAIDMQPGEWEISSTMEMPGMPMKMPASSYTQCLTAEDLIPKSSQQMDNSQCKIISQEQHGGTVTWEIVCDNPQGEMKSRGEITYHGTSFSGEVKTSGGGMPGEMLQKMDGKRLGPCR